MKYMKDNGEVHIMRECEWNAKSFHHVPTQMPLINIKRQTEKQLLEAVKNGEIFGFVVCDVSTPAHIQVFSRYFKL